MKETLDNLSRIKTAAEFVRDGMSLSVGEVIFYCGDAQTLGIGGWSRSPALEIITQQSALKELLEIINLYNDILEICPRLLDLAEKKQVMFSLGFDYGMGTIRICSMKNGIVTWDVNLKS